MPPLTLRSIIFISLLLFLMLDHSIGFVVMLSAESLFLDSQRLYMSNDDNDPLFDNQQSFSYVEGSEYDNEEEEIMAMGGDPSFLMDFKEDDMKRREEDDEKQDDAPKWLPTDGNGPQPKPPSKFTDMDEWDGTVDESAHFD
mmetsp:Transcript_18826/g.27841  ORF Transcript_18826/g.27841 Transcript_18826/m.27841 type:complete len:142 (+) Transcript_18826:51-476(+)